MKIRNVILILIVALVCVLCFTSCSTETVNGNQVADTLSDNTVTIFGEKDISSDSLSSKNTAPVSSDQSIDSGSCGETLTWVLDENGVLTISGTGDMENWDTPFSSALRATRSPFFEYKQIIHEVVLDSGVTSIGNYAFAECQNLSLVKLSTNIVCIGSGAFKNCINLIDCSIPNGIIQIGDEAFSGCKKITEISIPDGVTKIGINAFDGCSQLTSITIPSGVLYIGKYTFNNCTNLNTVIINNGTLELGQGAFYNCCGLTNIGLPNSITSIGYETFYGCNNLTSISIPSSVAQIDSSAFRKCSGTLVFYVEQGSFAENYARKYGFKSMSENSSNTTDTYVSELNSQCSIGSYVTFGSYSQNSDGDDSTPIEWLVLDRNGEKVLLLSHYGLDYQRYNKKKNVDVTWETCSLRSWLNSDFYNKAFTIDEQKIILTTDVDNSQAQCCADYKTSGGNNTRDRVFLLSYAEANMYLYVTYLDNPIEARMSPTDYAIAQGAEVWKGTVTEEGKDAGQWWLRSPGFYQKNAAYVYASGSLNDIARDFTCVRPALWVDLSLIQ